MAAVPLESGLTWSMTLESKQAVVLQSTLTCPSCGHRSIEEMPTNSCLFFYDCPGCGALLRPKEGDCCVFCSYGTVPCPPKQQEGSCCH